MNSNVDLWAQIEPDREKIKIPQPYRFINSVINKIIEDAADHLYETKKKKSAIEYELTVPVCNADAEIKIPVSGSCSITGTTAMECEPTCLVGTSASEIILLDTKNKAISSRYNLIPEHIPDLQFIRSAYPTLVHSKGLKKTSFVVIAGRSSSNVLVSRVKDGELHPHCTISLEFKEVFPSTSGEEVDAREAQKVPAKAKAKLGKGKEEVIEEELTKTKIEIKTPAALPPSIVEIKTSSGEGFFWVVIILNTYETLVFAVPSDTQHELEALNQGTNSQQQTQNETNEKKPNESLTSPSKTLTEKSYFTLTKPLYRIPPPFFTVAAIAQGLGIPSPFDEDAPPTPDAILQVMHQSDYTLRLNEFAVTVGCAVHQPTPTSRLPHPPAILLLFHRNEYALHVYELPSPWSKGKRQKETELFAHSHSTLNSTISAFNQKKKELVDTAPNSSGGKQKSTQSKSPSVPGGNKDKIPSSISPNGFKFTIPEIPQLGSTKLLQTMPSLLFEPLISEMNAWEPIALSSGIEPELMSPARSIPLLSCVSTAAVSPAGAQWIVGCQNGAVFLGRTRSALFHALSGHYGEVRDVSFIPFASAVQRLGLKNKTSRSDSSFAVSAGADTHIQVYDCANAKIIHRLPFSAPPAPAPVQKLSFLTINHADQIFSQGKTNILSESDELPLIVGVDGRGRVRVFSLSPLTNSNNNNQVEAKQNDNRDDGNTSIRVMKIARVNCRAAARDVWAPLKESIYKITGPPSSENELPLLPIPGTVVDEDDWESRRIEGNAPPPHYGVKVRRFASVASSSEVGVVVVGVEDELNQSQNFTRQSFPPITVLSDPSYLSVFIINSDSLLKWFVFYFVYLYNFLVKGKFLIIIQDKNEFL